MRLLSLEQSQMAYRVDFALYTAAVVVMALYVLQHLAWGATWPQHRAVAAWVLAGLAGWSLAEYLLHRFVLHGLPPFRAWHAQHHARPTALVFAPTLLSGTLVVGLVFLPGWWLLGWWPACALTLGLLAGYLSYTLTHHALHHSHRDGVWLQQRRRWHASHHAPGAVGRYGVTSGFWDGVFGTARPPRPPRHRPSPALPGASRR